MTTQQLQQWVKNLSIEDHIDLVMFYSRLCAVCGQLDKKKKI